MTAKGNLKNKPIQLSVAKSFSKVIAIPPVAANYNNEVSHVDQGGQLRAYTAFGHRIYRGAWQALTWTSLLEVVLLPFYNRYQIRSKGASIREALGGRRYTAISSVIF